MRDLSWEECEFVAGGDGDDIVVTGEREPPPPPPPAYYPPYEPSQPPPPPPAPTDGSGQGGGGGSAPAPVTPTDQHNSDGTAPGFKITLQDQSHLSKAIESYNNVKAGVAGLLSDLSHHNSSDIISYDGKVMSVGDLINEINHTTYVISDGSFNNAGVGGAHHGSDGFNTDTLSYSDFSNSGGYSNQVSREAILLHELGHMSADGGQFFDDSIAAYKAQHGGSDAGFYGSTLTNSSDYMQNNEAFANDFMVASAKELGYDISGFVSASQNAGWWYNATPVDAMGAVPPPEPPAPGGGTYFY